MKWLPIVRVVADSLCRLGVPEMLKARARETDNLVDDAIASAIGQSIESLAGRNTEKAE